MVAFTMGQASGLYSAPLSSWHAAFDACRDEGATIIGWTETHNDARARQALPAGWFTCRFTERGRDNCSISWWSGRWALGWWPYSYLLANHPWYDQSGKRKPPIFGTVVPLFDTFTGRFIIIGGVHAPSDVGGPTGWQGPRPRIINHHQMYSNLRPMFRQGMEKIPKAGRILTGDWNLNYQREWVRDLWEDRLPAFTPCWKNNLPARLGTIGGGSAVYDWIAIDGRLKYSADAEVVANVPIFDHNPLVAHIDYDDAVW